MAKTLTILRRLGRDSADFDLQRRLVIADHPLQRAHNSARANNVPRAMYKQTQPYTAVASSPLMIISASGAAHGVKAREPARQHVE